MPSLSFIDRQGEIKKIQGDSFVQDYFELTEIARSKAEWAAREFLDDNSEQTIVELTKIYTENMHRELGINVTDRFPYDLVERH